MYHPSLDTIRELSSSGNLVPIYREIVADLETPVSAYLKVARGKYSFLLESVEGGERLGRYSFIGTDPYEVLITGPGTEAGAIDPLRPLEHALSAYRPVHVEGLPRFLGGAIGYLAYETFRYYEPKVPAPDLDPIGVPESVLMLVDTVIVFDHLKHLIKVVSYVHTEGDLTKAYQRAVDRIEIIANRLAEPLQGRTRQGSISDGIRDAVSNFTEQEYVNLVDRCKEYVVAGDVIQVVPSRRVAVPTQADPLRIYRELRTLNPSPYMYFLNFGEFQIIGASPEALVRVEDGVVYNFPLAGTLPRGATPEEDQALAERLRNDEKERAEHIMLVDLGRNDVGRVSKSGTVKVTDLMRVVRYSHVMHLESEVQGELRDDCTMFDALRSCMPAGTLSGAPKIRAMEIIAEVEPEKRGPYGAAIGYFDFQGNMDTAIPIRTIILKNEVAYLQAGGGIVYDSDPKSEYDETTNKLAAPLNAIRLAESEIR